MAVGPILYFSIIIILISLSISIIIYKDILSPAILITLPWLMSLILLIPSSLYYNANSIYFIYFSVGILIFNAGYLITASGKRKNRRNKGAKLEISVNNKLLKFIIILEVIFVLGNALLLLIYTKNNYVFNIYFTLKSGVASGDLNIYSIFGYLNNFIIAFTAFIIYIFIQFKNPKAKRLLVIQIIIGSVSNLLTLNRTSILLFCILVAIMFAVYSNLRSKTIFKYAIIYGILGVIFFSVYNLAKYPYLLESQSALEVSLGNLFVYGSSSMVAFQSWIISDVDLLYGENTFRFSMKLLEAVGYDLSVPGVLQPFVSVGEYVTSNVYTFYHYYAEDFGLMYALLAQFLVGLLHGFLYKKMTYKNPFWVYIFSISLYPLFMQFFQDQYISITSAWIQLIFFGLILFKSGIFMKVKFIEE